MDAINVQHDATGLIFEKGNVVALADTLERLIGDPELRGRLGKAGRRWVESERTWAKTVSSLFTQLKKL